MATISSNINEVIRAVLNSLIFFLQKNFALTKSTTSTKNTKTQKRDQAKAQNRNKRSKIKNALKNI